MFLPLHKAKVEAYLNLIGVYLQTSDKKSGATKEYDLAKREMDKIYMWFGNNGMRHYPSEGDHKRSALNFTKVIYE